MAYLLIYPLTGLVLTGCISESPGIPDIFLVELINTTGDNTQLRLNYFGRPTHSPEIFKVNI